MVIYRILGVLLLGSMALVTSPAQARTCPESGQLDLLLRNLYWDQNGHAGAQDRREWGQGLQLAFQSGCVPGPVALSVHAHVQAALQLDSRRDRSGTGLLVPDGPGDVRHEAVTGGAALQWRVGDTLLQYGDVRPYNPVMAMSDMRLMAATARGWWLVSQSVPSLWLEAGHFGSAQDFNRTHHGGRLRAAYAGVAGGDLTFVGVRYQGDQPLELGFYASRHQDLWHQYHLHGRYRQEQGAGQALILEGRLYRSLDQGRARAGRIRVTAWSLTAAWEAGAHRWTLGHQSVHGDQPLDYLGLDGGGFQDSIFLAHASQYADFNGPGERSWSLRYDLDLASLGIPGLSLMARHIRSEGVDADAVDPAGPYARYGDDERHWERDLELRYVVPRGWARNLSIHLRQATHRTHGRAGENVDQLRLILNWPLDLI